MARLPKISPVGVPVHIIQRGNSRQACFAAQENYRALFVHHVEGELLDEIRLNINKGMAFGHDWFKEEIESLTGRRLKPKKIGRPVGWRKKMDDI